MEFTCLENLAKELVGEGLRTAYLSALEMEKHAKRNPESIFVLREQGRVQAFFIAASLTRAQVEKIQTGVIASGFEIAPEECEESLAKAQGVYLMGVYAREGYRSHIKERLKESLGKPRGDILIFAKASTSLGEKAMKRIGFKKVADGAKIQCANLIDFTSKA